MKRDKACKMMSPVNYLKTLTAISVRAASARTDIAQNFLERGAGKTFFFKKGFPRTQTYIFPRRFKT